MIVYVRRGPYGGVTRRSSTSGTPPRPPARPPPLSRVEHDHADADQRDRAPDEVADVRFEPVERARPRDAQRDEEPPVRGVEPAEIGDGLRARDESVQDEDERADQGPPPRLTLRSREELAEERRVRRESTGDALGTRGRQRRGGHARDRFSQKNLKGSSSPRRAPLCTSARRANPPQLRTRPRLRRRPRRRRSRSWSSPPCVPLAPPRTPRGAPVGGAPYKRKSRAVFSHRSRRNCDSCGFAAHFKVISVRTQPIDSNLHGYGWHK